jgi:membrane associated rhomboid family serine protease
MSSCSSVDVGDRGYRVAMASEETLPRCAVHDDRFARRRCPRCDRPVCEECLTSGDGAEVCPWCRRDLAVGATRATPAARPPGRVRRRQASAPVTFGLLAVYVAVFLLGTATGGTRSPIAIAGAQINALVVAGEWWRVLTATMLHAGVTHLLFNGYALYVLGPQLERGVGSLPFAALYLASGLAGGIAFLFAAPDQVAVGASGAIFGLFGAWLVAAWANRDTPHGRAGLSQFGLLLAINLALPLFVPNIAWQAHLGGLLVGLASGLWWAARRRAGVLVRAGGPAVIAGVLLAGLLWYT